ncbi:MAG TPA: TlpA disulfide reductase family protein [Kiloniellales bacterium]
MLQKKALTAVCAGLLAGMMLVAVSGPAPAAGGPPLADEFADNFTLLDPPVPAPLDAFQELAGRRVRLADFAGRVVVLNFWATWCAPCVREMPALDRMQALLHADGLTVVAVSVDRGGAALVEPFAQRLGLKNLGLYLDPQSTLARAFGITGLPTTFVIDMDSRIVGALQGAAEWDSPAALALLRYYLPGRSDPDKQSAANNQRVGTGVSPE